MRRLMMLEYDMNMKTPGRVKHYSLNKQSILGSKKFIKFEPLISSILAHTSTCEIAETWCFKQIMHNTATFFYFEFNMDHNMCAFNFT